MSDIKQFIKRIGGALEVAERLGVYPSAVSNWNVRGISFAYRDDIKAIAREKGVRVQERFFKAPQKRPKPEARV